jgi:hypothetical protein
MKYCKLLLAVVGASVLFGALASTASAGRLSSSSQRLLAGWSRMDFSGGFGTVECKVTLLGTMHSRTINKTAGALIGYITDAQITRPCIRGEATIHSETLPWHVTYSSFAGTLPAITSFRTNVIGASFRIREPTFGATCTARTESGEPGIGTYNRNTGTGAITNAQVGGTIRTSCGTSGSFSGTSNSIDSITITLI